MRFAWLILAHDAPDQLQALITRLLDGNDDLAIVHIDRRAGLWPHGPGAIDAGFAGRVLRVEPAIAVHWGHHSQLDAIGLLLQTALAHSFDVAHLLSGRDWPMRPRDQIAAEIAAAPATCWIDATSADQAARMQRWWLHARYLNPRVDWGARDRLVRKILRIASRYLSAMAPRSQPYGPWRKGFTWWSLPRDACARVAHALADIQRSGRTRHTACSDEHVVQTVVHAIFPTRIAPARRYTDWPIGQSSPRILTRHDMSAIRHSGAWIARKVDAQVDDWFYDPAM